MKVGRNDPCPCGSGKKYKHCHGGPKPPGQAGAKTVAVGEGTFDVQTGGLPGQHVELSMRAVFQPVDDPRNQGGSEGVPGQYEVSVVLARPGTSICSERERKFAEDLEGDSHVGIAKPFFSPPGAPDARQVLVECQTQDGALAFTGHANPAGFLGKFVSAPFFAASHRDAQRKAYRALSSSLSNMAVLLDVPIRPFQIESKELRTSSRYLRMQNPFREAPMAVAEFHALEQDFRAYASLYREALNSNSVVYRFLGIYKIIEGIRARRVRLAAEAKQRSETFTRPREAVPQETEQFNDWLNDIFHRREQWDELTLQSVFRPEVTGKKLGTIIDDILRPHRNDIAHALTSDAGEPTHSADELLHVDKTSKLLPVATCIARRMLKNEFPATFQNA